MNYVGIEESKDSKYVKIRRFRIEKSIFKWISEESGLIKNIYFCISKHSHGKIAFEKMKKELGNERFLAREVKLENKGVKNMIVNYTGGNILSILGPQNEMNRLVEIFLKIDMLSNDNFVKDLNFQDKGILNRFLSMLKEKEKDSKNEK